MNREQFFTAVKEEWPAFRATLFGETPLERATSPVVEIALGAAAFEAGVQLYNHLDAASMGGVAEAGLQHATIPATMLIAGHGLWRALR